MNEWRSVSGSPIELSSDSASHPMLNVRVRSNISDFKLSGKEIVLASEIFEDLSFAQVPNIANSVESLEELKVPVVMNHPQHIVVSGSHLEGVKLGSLCVNPRDGIIHIISGLHESLILSLDLVNNSRGVDLISP